MSGSWSKNYRMNRRRGSVDGSLSLVDGFSFKAKCELIDREHAPRGNPDLRGRISTEVFEGYSMPILVQVTSSSLLNPAFFHIVAACHRHFA